MKYHFNIILVLFSNPTREKRQSEWANSAIEAALKAEKKNPGYFCKEVTEIEN